MKINEVAQNIVDTFKGVENRERAVKMEAYLKNKFVLLGIMAPERKQLLKVFYPQVKVLNKTELKELVLKLYEQPYRELHYAAIDILCRRLKHFDMTDFDFGVRLATEHSWWDTVDSIASNFFGHIMQGMEGRASIEFLIYNENMWLNRVGIIYQLKYKDKVNTSILEEAIVEHKDSKEFFHRKAIGWALRQYSRYNPSWVLAILEKHTFSNLSVREARKYL